jgi:hypothetical protein
VIDPYHRLVSRIWDDAVSPALTGVDAVVQNSMPIITQPDSEVPSILDVEASGFGAGSYPIEIGYISGDGSSYCTLIRPAPTWTHCGSDRAGHARNSPRGVAALTVAMRLRLRATSINA